MALTKAQVREILSAAGVDGDHMKDAVDKIIDGHLASIDALREEIDTHKAEAETLKGVQKELDAVKAELETAKSDLETSRKGSYKEKFETLQKEFDAYKGEQAAKEAKAAKEAAARSYYESKGITGDALRIAMRGSGAEIEALELKDGKVKDTAALEALVKGEFAGLVSATTTKGANTATPPANIGGHAKTKDEIMNIKDAGERQRAIAENPALFGI